MGFAWWVGGREREKEEKKRRGREGRRGESYSPKASLYYHDRMHMQICKTHLVIKDKQNVGHVSKNKSASEWEREFQNVSAGNRYLRPRTAFLLDAMWKEPSPQWML